MLQDCHRCPNHSNAMFSKTGSAGNRSTEQESLIQDKIKQFRTENVHKDIGYSSDAELSEPASGVPASAAVPSSAVTLSPSSSCRSSSQGRKKVIKRRQRSKDVKLSPSSSTGCLTMQSKRRPWSFHAATEWTDWDYYQPPSFSIPAADQDDFYCNDENAVRSLIEFGENYEHWFRTDDGCVGLRASTPIQDSNDLMMQQRLRPPHHKCDCAARNAAAAGSETDTGKSSGCCLSDGEESNYSGEELEHDRDASSLIYIQSPVNRISFANDVSTECLTRHVAVSAADACTITTSVSTCNTGTCTDPLVVQRQEGEKIKPSARRRSRSSSSITYMIFFTFSLVSLFVSIFFADRPPHVQLSFATSPPV